MNRKSSELKMNLPSRGTVEPLTKKLKLDESFFNSIREDADVIKVRVVFRKSDFKAQTFPKSTLLEYAKRNCDDMPSYRTEQVDKLFYSTVTVDGKRYATDYL